MRIEVYDGNLSPSKELDQSVVRATDLFHRHHLDISAPVSVIEHNSHLPGIYATYHGLYTVGDKPTHLVSVKRPETLFSFPDRTPWLVHELTHAVQAEVGGSKPIKHNPLLGGTGDSFVQHRISEFLRHRSELTLEDVVAEGVAMFAKTTYIRESKGPIFDRLLKSHVLTDHHDSVQRAMKVIYPKQDLTHKYIRDNIDGQGIGYRMMKRFEKVWSRENSDANLLREMTQISLSEIADIPVLAKRGGINPEFLHFYYHPEDLPVVPLSTQPSASA